jgi:hypothetical protein
MFLWRYFLERCSHRLRIGFAIAIQQNRPRIAPIFRKVRRRLHRKEAPEASNQIAPEFVALRAERRYIRNRIP